MNTLFQFPRATFFGKVIPKSKIYQYAKPNTRTRELFVEQIDKIIWTWKLSPETTNISAGENIQEIQVLTLLLKTVELHHDVLLTIDRAIPSPILFELKYNGKVQYASAYKKRIEDSKKNWIVSTYFHSEWINEDQEKVEMPLVLHLGALYRYFLTTLCSIKMGETESLEQFIKRVEGLSIKDREAHRIENVIHKEKQFNRRVEMNRKLNKLKQEIQELNSI